MDQETEQCIQANVSQAVNQAQCSMLGSLDQFLSSKLEAFDAKISENKNLWQKIRFLKFKLTF